MDTLREPPYPTIRRAWQDALLALTAMVLMAVSLAVVNSGGARLGDPFARHATTIAGSLIAVAVFGVFAFRAARLGVTRRADEVVVRGVLSTRRLATGRIVGTGVQRVSSGRGSRYFVPSLAVTSDYATKSMILWWLATTSEQSALRLEGRLKALVAS